MKRLGYLESQCLFFLTLVALWAFLALGFYTSDVFSQEQEFTRALEARQDQREQVLWGIKDDEILTTAYKRKLELAQSLAEPYVRSLFQLIREDRLAEISSLEIPLPVVSGVFIGRKSRPVFQKGNDFSHILGKDWMKQIMMALNSSDKDVFALAMTRFYTFPIERVEFDQQINQFVGLNFRSFQFLRYYHEWGDYRWFFLIDLDNLKPDMLKAAVLDSLPLPPKSIITLGKWLYDTWPVHIAYLLLVTVIFYNGGYLILFTRFSSRLILVSVVFASLVFLILQWAAARVIHTRMDLYNERAVNTMNSIFAELEEDYNQFVVRLGQQVADEFRAGGDFQGSHWKDGLVGMIAYEKGRRLYRSDEAGGYKVMKWTHTVIKLSIGFLINHHVSDNKAGWRSALNEFGFIKRYGGYENEVVVRFLENRIGGFVERPGDAFFYFPVVAAGMYGFWTMRGQAPERDLLVLMISDRAMVNLWYEDAKKRKFEFLAGASVIFRDLSSEGLVFGLGMDETSQFSRESLDFYWSKWVSRSHPFLHVDNGQRKFLARMGLSSLFIRHRLMVILPAGRAEEIFISGHRSFFLAALLALLLFLGLGFGLVYRISSLVYRLREGFRRFSDQDWAYQIPVSGQDEGEQTVLQFNSFLQEMSHMQKLLPFVSPAVLAVLSEKGRTLGHRERAVVLVSDIRAFTTLSETLSPEQVVDLLNRYFSLWQERIDRYGGVVERFVGDAIRVVYFASRSRHFVQNALQTALEVKENLGSLGLRNGCGLVLGEVEFIMVGDEHKMEFLALGQAAEMSEELEKMSAKGQYTGILVEDGCHEILKDFYTFVPVCDKVWELKTEE